MPGLIHGLQLERRGDGTRDAEGLALALLAFGLYLLLYLARIF